jgi:nucleoside-diphosphate-sugar epimerase
LGEAAAKSLGIKLRRLKLPKPLLYCAAVISEARSRARRRPQLFDRDKYRDLVQPGWVADVSKAYTLLSFRPRYTLEEAAKETMAWYLTHKWR